MTAKKTTLEKLDQKTLLKYIQPESQFTNDAKIIAFQILTERNYKFSELEQNYLTELKIKKTDEIEQNKFIHPKYITASNFVFISAGLGIISFSFSLFARDIGEVISGAISLGSVFLIGFLIRKGISVMKHVLLVFFLLGILLSLKFLPVLIVFYPIEAIIFLIQSILQFLAIIYLYRIPKVGK